MVAVHSCREAARQCCGQETDHGHTGKASRQERAVVRNKLGQQWVGKAEEGPKQAGAAIGNQNRGRFKANQVSKQQDQVTKITQVTHANS